MKKQIAITAAIVLGVLFMAYPWANSLLYSVQSDRIENIVTIKVTWKERVSSGGFYQQHYYLIYGELEDGSPCVLQNADSPQRNKYNGSDIYQQIDIGRVYTFFVTGERNPNRSRYPNIIEILENNEDWREQHE